jgi:CHAD domain-containing protein
MDPGYLALAVKYVRRQAKQLAEQLDGIDQAKDIEFVHRARVASRRLRIALRMFRDCFGTKTVKRWRKCVRLLSRDLSEARDKDVQIVFVCGVLDAVKDPQCYPGIARLLVKLERKRQQIQIKVLAAVKRLRTSGILEEIQTTTKRLWSDLMAVEFDNHGEFAVKRTRKAINRRLNKLLTYRECLRNPEDIKNHHAMRIAAKRLRYTLEIAKPIYDERIQTAIDAVKKLQAHLGDIHDCDVWVDQLEAFREEERKEVQDSFGHDGPLSRLSVGIDYLLQDRRARRRESFLELVELWMEINRDGILEGLLRTIGFRGESNGAENDSDSSAPEKTGIDVPAPSIDLSDANRPEAIVAGEDLCDDESESAAYKARWQDLHSDQAPDIVSG